MIKRFLVLMGETPSSGVAREFAYRLARDTGAAMAGLAGIDLATIEASMPTPVGGIALKARLEEELKREADGTRRRLHDLFAREAAAQNLAFDWRDFSGDANETLQLAIEDRDLVVTGHDTAFHGDVRENFPEMLSHLLRATPRPVIVCPDAAPAGSEILVCYDGSVAAMRALQLFVLLGLGATARVCVTSVDANQDTATRRAHGAAGYLRAHGIEPAIAPIASKAHAADIIRAQVADRGCRMLVMGAYGHGGLHALLFGSATRHMVEDPPCGLFIYH